MTATDRRSGALLSVRDLSVEFDGDDGPLRIVHELSLDVMPGETFCLVGESGSGKSLTALSVLRLLPAGIRIGGGTIAFAGRDLAAASERELRAVRGREIGFVCQDPLTALDPLVTVGRQVADALHGAEGARVSRAARRARVRELLEMVGIPNPASSFDRYPHEYSGGMRQRVGIAIAMANGPRLIVADEPTTALDVTVQAQILDLLDLAKRETGAAVLLITHDLGVVAERADRVEVMYAGRIVERAAVGELFAQPRHPYTVALLACSPGAAADPSLPLAPIAGQSVRAGELPSGCAFHPRCRLMRERGRCAAERPPLAPAGGETHESACWFMEELGGAEGEALVATSAPVREETGDRG